MDEDETLKNVKEHEIDKKTPRRKTKTKIGLGKV
jgi:hypothetical protein